MKKQIVSVIVFTATALSIAAGGNVEYSIQPASQLVPVGADAKFTVTAGDGPLACQWLRDGAPLTGQTNRTLVIPHAQVRDVAQYTCAVTQGAATVPTPAATLMVFTSSTDPVTGVDPVVVYATATSKSGSQGTCPGAYIGYIYYAKSATNGWGWAPDTTGGNTVFTATDTNQTDTKIVFSGMYGDSGCNQTAVTVPNAPTSPAYQFYIYFTNNLPTNPYAITLNGFKP